MESPVAPEASTSDLALFLKSLAEDGRAVVSTRPLTNETDEALGVLRQMNEYARNGLALDAPQFSAPAALWQRVCSISYASSPCAATSARNRSRPPAGFPAPLTLTGGYVLATFTTDRTNLETTLQNLTSTEQIVDDDVDLPL